MMLQATHRAILDLIVEDSYGLWEIAGRFEDLYPDRSHESARRIAQETTRQLIDAGLASLWYQQTAGGEELAVPPTNMSAELARESNWEAPDGNRPQVRLLTTDAGQEAYYSDAHDG